jgi:hypothetical protein
VVGTSLHGGLDPTPQGSRRRTCESPPGRPVHTSLTFKESARVQSRGEVSDTISPRHGGFVSRLSFAPPRTAVPTDAPVTDVRGT